MIPCLVHTERASKMVETQIKSALKAAKAKGVDPNASTPKALIREVCVHTKDSHGQILGKARF